jgi:E3 ubiquitin-protein ligase HUWE1
MLLAGIVWIIWLQEDDELAQALAMSLSNDGLLKADARDGNKGKEVVSQEEGPRAPSIVDMLSTCISLLQKSDVAAFSLADLLVTMCNRNKGRDRLHVVSFLAQQLKSQRGEASVGDNSALSTIAHTLALVLNEDSAAREVAAENGLVCTALEILESFTPVRDAVKPDVPKWVTALLLVLDHLLQYKVMIHADAPGGAATTAATSSCVAVKSNLAV